MKATSNSMRLAIGRTSIARLCGAIAVLALPAYAAQGRADASGQGSVPLPASVRALADAQCKLHTAGAASSSGIPVFTDGDGYARFYARRTGANDTGRRMVLDCMDSSGKAQAFNVDLASDSTFEAHPQEPSKQAGSARPGLQGDPLAKSQAELLKLGYGLRPDPKEGAAAYARWLAAARRDGHVMHIREGGSPHPNLTPRTILPSAQTTTTTAPNWVGAELTGAPPYTETQASFNVPTGIPGGDNTGDTQISIWSGVNGPGLIQTGVFVSTTANSASYGIFREYCCGDAPSNNYTANFNAGPGHEVFTQSWFCDENGIPSQTTHYGCTFLEDETTGNILNCVSPTDPTCPSVAPLPAWLSQSFGTDADFIIELEEQPAFTDFVPTVVMTGEAYSAALQSWVDLSSDPAVTELVDFTPPLSTQIDVTLQYPDQVLFTIIPTPAPTITISANPASITSGGTSTVTWSVTNATSCFASDAWSGSNPAVSGGTPEPSSRSLLVAPIFIPNSNGTGAVDSYSLTCNGPGGTSTATAYVAALAPTIVISASPASISAGDTSTLKWSAANAASCFASDTWSGSDPAANSGQSEPFTGSLLVTPIFLFNPTGPGAVDAYSLTCKGPGGSSTGTAHVAALAPTVTITASSTQISPGQTVSLTWASTNAIYCLASDAWPGTSPAPLAIDQDPPGLTVTPTFTPNVFQSFDTYPITCTGLGGSVTAAVTVTVFGPYQKQWCGGWWGGGPCVCLRCVFGPIKGGGGHPNLGEFGPFTQIQPDSTGPVLVLLSGTVETVSVDRLGRAKSWGGGNEVTTITISPGSKVVTSGELGRNVRIVEANADSSKLLSRLPTGACGSLSSALLAADHPDDKPKIVGVAFRKGKLAGLLVAGDDQPLAAPPAK